MSGRSSVHVVCVQTHVPDNVDQSLYGHRPFKYFALFDGHGGSEAARFAESKLKDEILSQYGFWSDEDDIAQSMREGFIYMHLPMKESNYTDIKGLRRLLEGN